MNAPFAERPAYFDEESGFYAITDFDRKMSREDWPETVGRPWQEAEEAIRKEYPKMTVQVLPENSMVTMDYRVDRVRIFTDGDGKVVVIPRIG